MLEGRDNLSDSRPERCASGVVRQKGGGPVVATAAKGDVSDRKSVAIRISSTSHQALRALAEQCGEPIQTVLDKAIETYRRQRFFEALNAAYAALREDPGAWKEELEERAAWDATLQDGRGDG
jgi:hypothetical protein